MIGQVEAMLAAPVSASPFVQMAKADAPKFKAQLEELERAKIRPAIGRYRDFLKSTYLPAAREAIGVSANPNGPACYAAAVKYHATVDMTPKEIHDARPVADGEDPDRDEGDRQAGARPRRSAGDSQARQDGSEVSLQEPRRTDRGGRIGGGALEGRSAQVVRSRPGRAGHRRAVSRVPREDGAGRPGDLADG